MGRLAELDETTRVLDYGCGKLRYTIPLARRVATVCAVDSEYQLARSQAIGGQTTTVREYASHLSNVVVMTPEECLSSSIVCDYVLCANVLSAIPDLDARTEVLAAAAGRLSSHGRGLVCTQYRHSSFAEYANCDRARRYADGYLIRDKSHGTSASFYGMIDRPSLVAHVERAGLRVTRSYVHDKSAYVEFRTKEPAESG